MALDADARCAGSRQRHPHAVSRSLVLHRVGSRAAVQIVSGVPALDSVVFTTAIQSVRPRAAMQPVDAAAAVQTVVAAEPVQVVVARTACHRVPKLRADDLLKPADRVPRRVTSAQHPRREIQIHSRIRPQIGRRVPPGAALQGVRPRTALHVIVAATAPQRVRTAQAIQIVVAGSADECVVVVIPSQNRHGCSSTSKSVSLSQVSRERAESPERARRPRTSGPMTRTVAGATAATGRRTPAPTGENASLARRWNL